MSEEVDFMTQDITDHYTNKTKDSMKKLAKSAKPRPWVFSQVGSGLAINPTWVALYMKTHDLSLEVAVEHATVHMRRFIDHALKSVEKLERSDEASLNQIKTFVDLYKPDDYYGDIPLVGVLHKSRGESVSTE